MRAVRRGLRALTIHVSAGLAVAVLAGACAAAQPDTAPLSAPVSAQAAADAASAKFQAFIADFRDTAIKAGIAPATYDRSMAGLSLNPRIEQANLQQPEFVKPIWEYLDTGVSDKRVATGAQMR